MSILSIFTVVVLVGGVTFALFSSAASNNNNTFGAGTLTLSINTISGSGSTAIFSVSDLDPGEMTDVQKLDLKNGGTVDASDVKLTSIVVNPTPATPNLGDKLILTLYNDANNNNSYDAGIDLPIDTGALTSLGWADRSLGFGLTGGELHTIFAKILFDSSADDAYQGTSVDFAFNFLASQ